MPDDHIPSLICCPKHSQEFAERMERLTWRCDICKEERPDSAIDVAYRPLRGLEDQFPDTRFNLKFCNDKTDCKARAHGPGPWPEEEK